MPFVIQTINNQIAFDFGLNLKQYTERSFHSYSVYLSENPIKNYIPIGSVNFVHDAIKLIDYKIPKPINIPESLMGRVFTNRNVFHTNNLNDIHIGDFVKSNTKIKDGFTGVIYDEFTKDNLVQDEYLVSEFVDFSAEWRAFILNGKILDIRKYSGNYMNLPKFCDIENMVKSYTDAPVAYTIDVGVLGNITYLIEIHNFYSCGLYGLHMSHAIPMWIEWWSNFTRNTQNKLNVAS